MAKDFGPVSIRDKDMTEHLCPTGHWHMIVWFHDKSVFYVYNHHKKGWYHKDVSDKPYTKWEGALLIIADFVSADFRWLVSPDGKLSAWQVFRPGKNIDGYFTNADILDQVKKAIDILENYYPNYDHVLIYDNVTTHLKHAEDGLSARYMPKNVPKQGSNWGIEVSECDPATGNLSIIQMGLSEKSRSEWEMHNLRTADLNLSIIQRITLIQIYEEFLKAWRLSSRNEALQTLTCMTWKKSCWHNATSLNAHLGKQNVAHVAF